ncbi:ubiquitin-conjugating enzyme E2 6 [Geopyxis carbonaria]|nr:ubiquitin-conjugating enzyme E2 6 [Geopyxis carbonaria]
MASLQANKRLTREYKAISKNPPPYIQAHPSENNILEWHYIITGPPDTPYTDGQYWGTLIFPPDYPFKPPAIRMITPSGRFQTSTRLCLSISDFHPKSFNPAWEVSTILIGLLSFMNSDEMTTGSISASPAERKALAARSRWWNSTGGGSAVRHDNGQIVHAGTVHPGRKIGLGDAGKRFRDEWPEVDEENWKGLLSAGVDSLTGNIRAPIAFDTPAGSVAETVVRRKTATVPPSASSSAHQAGVVVKRGEGWLRRHRVWVGVAVFVGYVFLARFLE